MYLWGAGGGVNQKLFVHMPPPSGLVTVADKSDEFVVVKHTAAVWLLCSLQVA